MPAPSETYPTDSDRVLVGRVAGSDQGALAELYDRYGSTMYAVALRLSREPAEAEDIVLETFTQAWREASRYRSDLGSVVAWLTVICRSRALDRLRARRRRDRLGETLQVAGGELVPALGRRPPTADQDLEREERCERVTAALETLSAPQRKVLELAYWGGLSHSEIATHLGEPLGTVKTRVRAGMQKLRDSLRPYFPEHEG